VEIISVAILKYLNMCKSINTVNREVFLVDCNSYGVLTDNVRLFKWM